MAVPALHAACSCCTFFDGGDVATIKTFRELEVWQLAMDVVIECYGLTGAYPLEERYGLQRETRRSAVSIPSNIAEGHNGTHRPPTSIT